jgi:hypothetical protein
MAVLGEQYQYDVFFSYAWGTASGDNNLRDWSRAVATATASLLRQRFNGTGKTFDFYLDHNENRSGDDLDSKLEEEVKRSAIFVALISPYYSSPYCMQEAAWFCEANGLKGEGLAERLCLLRVQTTPDQGWPEQFKGSSGKPLLYIDLCNEHGQPRSMAKYTFEKILAGLAELIEQTALEIADKISTLESRLRAQEAYRRSQAPPDRPLFFFEAEPVDRARWAECGKQIKGVPSIVLPARDPKPATSISPEDDLQGCYGILMLRSRSDDDFGRRIKSAYLHRQKLFRERREEVPWALLDDLQDGPPEEEVYEIPRVRLQGDWVKALQQTFRC